MIFTGHGDAAVQILHDHRAAQQIFEDGAVTLLAADQAGGNVHESRLLLHAPLPELVAPDGGEGQEGGPAPVPLFEELDSTLGVLLPVYHDVLHPRAQGGLQGHGVFSVGLHQAGHRPVDTPQGALLRRLHHQLDCLAEALVLLLHLRQHPDAGVQVVLLHGQLHEGVGRVLLPLLPALHAQGVALDDVGGGGGVLLGVLQGAAGGPDALPGVLQLSLDGGQLLLHRLLPGGHLLLSGAQGGQVLPPLGGGGGGQGLPGLEGADLAPRRSGAVGGGAGLFQKLLQLGLQSGDLAVQVLQTALLGSDLRLGVLPAAVLTLQLGLQLGDGVLPVADVGAQKLQRRLLVPRPGGEQVHLLPGLLLGGVVLLHPQGEAVVLLVEGVQLGLGFVLPVPGGGVFRLEAVLGGAQLLQTLHPQGNFQRALLVPEEEEPPGGLRLLPQGVDLELQLADLVVDAHQIFLGALEAALRLLLAVAELGDARRLLEDLPPVGAAGGEDLVDAALAHDGVALPAQARVHEKLVDVLEPDGLLVDIIFALAAAVVAAGDHDLAAVDGGEHALAVVQHQGHLGEAHGAPLLGAAEDHVLHLVPPEAPGGLLAHDPADGVGDIGFSRAVGAHDGGDALAEIQYGFIRKRLEALDLQCF